MDKVANIFRVEYGSIYKNDTGRIIENMAFVISRDSSVILKKYRMYRENILNNHDIFCILF